MRTRLLFIASLGTLVASSAFACSTFSEDGGGDAGPPDTSSSGEDTSTAEDAGDASDADPSATPLIPLTASGTTYFIEATEVTVAQFGLFKTRAADAGAPPIFPMDKCPGKAAFGPRAGCSAKFADTDPMTCIDWCDANAYCQAIGRHLCGAITGGPLPFGQLNDPTTDQWFRACRGVTGTSYPYGSDPLPDVCATQQAGPVAVGSLPGCEGGETGLHDMSGNAAEWVDSCGLSVTTPGDAGEAGPPVLRCTVRGGSYLTSTVASRCDNTNITGDPAMSYPDVGFRCCSQMP